MRPQGDGTPMPKASVRAAIRNLQRVEKNLREVHWIDREVLAIDWSAYDVDGAIGIRFARKTRRRS
jgi:hypothetical protein